MPQLIPLAQPTFGPEELEAVAAALASGWVAGQGPRGRELEGLFAALCGAEQAVAVNSCTAALHLALSGLGVGVGDEVIVADYTYPATGHAVLMSGARPVFADVRPDIWTVDPDAVAAAIGPRTVGLIAVDAFGQCADYAPLRELAARHDLFVIEDAACGVGATYQGSSAGSLADVACFSLHARKGITSGEGGVLVTDDRMIAEAARRRSCFGVESAYDRQREGSLTVPVFRELGYNYKLSDVLAAIAVVQLDRLPELLATRHRIAASYGERLRGVPGLTTPIEAEDRTHTWQSYVVTLDPVVDRAQVVRMLEELGIQSNIGTFASHLQPVYDEPPECPVSARLFAQHLAIPMHANLSDTDVDRVADGLRDVVRRELDRSVDQERAS